MGFDYDNYATSEHMYIFILWLPSLIKSQGSQTLFALNPRRFQIIVMDQYNSDLISQSGLQNFEISLFM